MQEHGSGKMHTEFIHLREKLSDLRLQSLEKKKEFENNLSNMNTSKLSADKISSESDASVFYHTLITFMFYRNSEQDQSLRSISPSRGRGRYKRSRHARYSSSSSYSSSYSESSRSSYESR